MHPLSIILVFVFLASLVILGAVLVGLSARRLRGQVHIGAPIRLSGAATLSMLLSSFVMALGLLFLAYGILGAYRVVWGA